MATMTRKRAAAEFGVREFPGVPPRVRVQLDAVLQLAAAKYGSVDTARNMAARTCSLCGSQGRKVTLLRSNSVCASCEMQRPDYQRMWISEAERRLRLRPEDFTSAGMQIFEFPSFLHVVKRSVFVQDAHLLLSDPVFLANRAAKAVAARAEGAYRRQQIKRRRLEIRVAADAIERCTGTRPDVALADAYISNGGCQLTTFEKMKNSSECCVREHAFAAEMNMAHVRETERWASYQCCGASMFKDIRDHLHGHSPSPATEFSLALSARAERRAAVSRRMRLAGVSEHGGSWEAPHPRCWTLSDAVNAYIREGVGGVPPSVPDALGLHRLPWVEQWTPENHLAVVGSQGVAAVQLLIRVLRHHGVPSDVLPAIPFRQDSRVCSCGNTSALACKNRL